MKSTLSQTAPRSLLTAERIRPRTAQLLTYRRLAQLLENKYTSSRQTMQSGVRASEAKKRPPSSIDKHNRPSSAVKMVRNSTVGSCKLIRQPPCAESGRNRAQIQVQPQQLINFLINQKENDSFVPYALQEAPYAGQSFKHVSEPVIPAPKGATKSKNSRPLLKKAKKQQVQVDNEPIQSWKSTQDNDLSNFSSLFKKSWRF